MKKENTMKKMIRKLSVLTLLFMLPGLPGIIIAAVPQPSHIIYGLAPDTALTVRLEKDDRIFAVYQMKSDPRAGGKYILRIPMGAEEPRNINYLRPGETARIYVDSATEPVVAVTLGEAGTIQRVDIGLDGSDTDSDDMTDGFEQRIIDAGDPAFNNFLLINPEDDFDGDGESNLVEFQNDTDPTNALSLNVISNIYSDFSFEIFQRVDQTGAGITAPVDFWGVELVCSPIAGESIVSGSMTKPEESIDPSNVLLTVLNQGSQARSGIYAFSDWNTLKLDYVPGEYRVKLELDNGTSHRFLRLAIVLSDYTPDLFPEFVTIQSPQPGETHVDMEPICEFSRSDWNFFNVLEVSDQGAESLVYSHDQGLSADTSHKVPADQLWPSTDYILEVDVHTPVSVMFGSRTRLTFGTAYGCDCDFDPADQDVDGLDLYEYIQYSHEVDLEVFSNEFGKIGCQ